MKALTICNPYAWLIATGKKRVENRTWYTGYRGPLASHAGLSRQWLTTEYPMPDSGKYFGAFLAVADLVACLHTDDIDRLSIPEEYYWAREHPHTNGPWCFILANVRQLAEPIPKAGAQQLWNVKEPWISRINAALPQEATA